MHMVHGMPLGLTLPLSVVLYVASLRSQLPLSAPAFQELLHVIIRAHMRQTETHRCHLRHDERFQRCVIMLNYSHMQITCILAVIARDWKHRYSICNYKHTGCADACMYVHTYHMKSANVCMCCVSACVNVFTCRGGIRSSSRVQWIQPFCLFNLTYFLLISE